MKNAEKVVFGGSGLNRGAHLRGDEAGLAKLAAAPEARSIVLWRGKPLISNEGALARVPLGHHGLAGPQIFLGLDQDAGIWATDLSAWVPHGVDLSKPLPFLDDSRQSHPDLPGAFADLRANMTVLTPRDAELAATARAVLNWHRSHRFCSNCGTKSDMIEAGWQRRCPDCGTRHFPRTDPVVIMLITKGDRVLVGRSPGWPEGMYSLLAGFVEPGETIEAAVRREVYEETRVDVGQVSYLASQPWPFPASLMIGCHGEATSDEITIDPVEIEDARWVDRQEMAHIQAGHDPVFRAARPGAIAHSLLRHWLADTLN